MGRRKNENPDLKKQRDAQRQKNNREKKSDSQKKKDREKDRDRKRLKRAADKIEYSESAQIKEQTEIIKRIKHAAETVEFKRLLQFDAEQARIKATKEEEVRCLLFANAKKQQTADVEELRCLVIDEHEKQQDRINVVDQRQSRKRKVMESTYKTALKHDVSEVEEFYLGKMDIECPHCGALYFKGEILSSRCCHKGKVKLPPLKKYPEPLKDLLLGSDKRSRDFRTHIRHIGKAPYCYRIHGAVYHEASVLRDETDQNPSFAQLYMYDARQAAQYRMKRFHNSTEADEQLMTDLHELIRRYNDATETDIAAVFVGDDGNVPCANDQGILVYPTHKKGQPTRIWNNSEHKDPMCYVLLFPNGDCGWTFGRKHESSHQTEVLNSITALQYYSYCFSVRGGKEDLNPILLGGRLFQQFVVDSYITVQSERLQYIRQHQTQLHTDQYRGLLDYVRSKAEDSNLKAGKIMMTQSFQKICGTVAYLKNRYPHTTLGNEIPYVKFCNRKVVLKHLRVPGSLTYVHIPPAGRESKHTVRACKGILVGYAIFTRGYRIWDPERDQVRESKHVKILENVGWTNFNNANADGTLVVDNDSKRKEADDDVYYDAQSVDSISDDSDSDGDDDTG
uniref:Uncharacterized protein n=1 Tax=Strigamia maritima TaxID=126957 RepID=T1IHC0_STRMM